MKTMIHTSLPTPPRETTKLLLKKLTSRRMRDVLEKRYGLTGGHKYTLEAIGKEYRITRERVRQIEADALRHLTKPEVLDEFQPVFQAIEAHIRQHGGVMAESHLLMTLARAKHHPALGLLLEAGPNFQRVAETDHYHSRWSVEKAKVGGVEKVIQGVVRELEQIGHPILPEDLQRLVQKNAEAVLGSRVEPLVAESYLGTGKLIRSNPYGEYGLAAWFSISPRGIKDKAYLVIAKAGKPLHFREVAHAINEVGWSTRKAHPQTVHNELIKDSRFVLVGRGLYALREWGYEPGVVRDVLVSILKQAKRPLAKQEVVQAVLEKRFVKEPTILLNLQNKTLFRKTDGGAYTLV